MNKIKSEIWDGRTPAKYISLKLDGMYLQIHKNNEDYISCYSSIGSNLTYQIKKCKPQWLLNLQKNMPLNSTILGELYYFDKTNRCGMPASYIKTGLANGENWTNLDSDILKSNIDGRVFNKRSIANEIKNNPGLTSDKQLCFSAFAILDGVNGIDAASSLEKVYYEILKFGIPFTPFIDARRADFLNEYNKEKLLGVLLEQYSARAIEIGVKAITEGWVLKDGNLIGWKKCKKENTLDVFIVDYIQGKGKYTGQVGSLVCAVCNMERPPKKIEICSVGGFNDEIRLWLTQMFNGWANQIIGQVIEITYQCVLSKGRLRHPRFVRFRDDKLVEECTTEQDRELLKIWG